MLGRPPKKPPRVLPSKRTGEMYGYHIGSLSVRQHWNFAQLRWISFDLASLMISPMFKVKLRRILMGWLRTAQGQSDETKEMTGSDRLSKTDFSGRKIETQF
jgi:hypothetical protein